MAGEDGPPQRRPRTARLGGVGLDRRSAVVGRLIQARSRSNLILDQIAGLVKCLSPPINSGPSHREESPQRSRALRRLSHIGRGTERENSEETIEAGRLGFLAPRGLK